MNARRILKVAAISFLAGLALGAVGLGVIMWKVHAALEEFSALAQQAHPHPGDHVAALMDYMNAEEHSLRDRNHAVWALGQLADPRARPALEAACTGEPCDHDRDLCQYELKKAIKRCGGTPTPPRKKEH